MVDYWAWHNKTLSEHNALSDEWGGNGYQFISLSVYGGEDRLYAAVMVRQENPVPQQEFPSLSEFELGLLIELQAADHYGLAIISANWMPTGVVFAAVFEPQDPLPLVALGLTSGPASGPLGTDTSTIQGMNFKAASSGRILRCVASYGFTEPFFAGIWVPNTDNTLWNNDGVYENGAEFDARLNAESAAWCRPGFVTMSPAGYYSSLFVANEVGPWNVVAGLTASEYQTAFNLQKGRGYLPICVQGAGISGASANFVAIFAKQTDVVARKFTATGPTANSIIDTAASTTMNQYPQVRHAALAIVHGVKLVYARGYTFAEPDWPLAYPTTCFRLASVSKTVTALAVFKLIELQLLSLTDTMQDILNLRTPGGGQPPDSRFSQITVQHLLEHTSGLPTDSFSDGPKVVAAFQAAGLTVSLPVGETMTDSYIASLDLLTDPGTTQVYSNCGYYLLGRIVANRWGGASSPIDAYQEILAEPLGITRLRAATDLVADQPEDEARYQASYDNNVGWLSDLQIGPSQMTPDQPIVAAGYGTDHLSLAQGAGGLSAAATDLARLPAILIDPADNPVLKRSTITQILDQASVCYSLQKAIPGSAGRAGYGFDVVTITNGGIFAQKGGEIIDAASVQEINGDWGFVALWGSTAAKRGNEWYPQWPAVMIEAADVSWGNVDLFPCFSMRSLAVPVASAFAPQPGKPDLMDVFLVGTYGAVTVFSGSGSANWESQQITDQWFAPLGAVLATWPQPGSPGQSDVFVVGADGSLGVISQASGGNWNLPLPISQTAFAPPGAPIAVASPLANPGQTSVFCVDLTGQLNVASVVGGGDWNAPQPISAPGFAPPGASIAVCPQYGVPGQTDVFVVDELGRVCVFFNDGGGHWYGPTPISAKNFAPPGACIAASQEYGNPNQTDVFVVGKTGYLYVFFAQGGGSWQGPSSMSTVRLTPGATVTVSPRFGAPDETDIFAVGPDGTLWNFSVTAGSYLTAATGPGAGFAPPGAGVAVGQPPGTANQTDLFVVSSDGTLCLLQSAGSGAWTNPPANLGTTL